MINWIECNLPYDFYGEYHKIEEPPNFDSQIKDLFGTTYELSKAKAMPYLDQFREFTNQLEDNDPSLLDDSVAKQKLLEQEALSSEPIRIVLEHRKFIQMKRDWVNQQPEYIAWEERCTIARLKTKEENNAKSFSGRKLNKPGTLIELEGGSIHLIGTINPIRGVCDDCTEFDSSAIVKRYAVVFDWSSIK